MAETRTRFLRLFVGLALVMAALAEGQTLLQSFRSERRLRARTERGFCREVEEAWSAIAPLLESGEGDGWRRAADEIRTSGLAREVEVLDLSGGPLSSSAQRPFADHEFDVVDRRAVLAGTPHCLVVESEGRLRALAYAAFPSSSPRRIVRLGRPDPDLDQEGAERSVSVLVHQLALGLLAIAGLLVLWPTGTGGESSHVAALGAYERAMESLRQRDVVQKDRHAAERDRLAVALREREAFSRAGEITAEIVHEVRNGLGTILGYARLLERVEGSAAEKGRLIRGECEGLETIVRRFVELVRDERPNLAPFDLRRMLTRVAEREAVVRDRPVPVVSAPASLPDLAGDETLLERAFENLLRNALDAAGSSGHVSLTVAVDGGTAVVAVSDDGPGFPGGSVPPVWSSSKPGGLGLGLSLARKIVTLHDGSLTLLPRKPRGVEAVVALPVAGPARHEA